MGPHLVVIAVAAVVVEKWNSNCSWHCKKKCIFPLRISSVNVTKSAGKCGFSHIYWRNIEWKTSFFVQCETIEVEVMQMIVLVPTVLLIVVCSGV